MIESRRGCILLDDLAGIGMCLLLNLLGTFLERPRSKKFPRTDSVLAYLVQGGGLFIDGGTVSIVGTNIYSNQAFNVRACFCEPSRYFL